MPRPMLPEDIKKGMVLRTRTQPWLFLAVQQKAQEHGRSISEEITAILCAALTSGVQTG
jgi:hypothetical protein